MPRELRYPYRRVINLTQEADYMLVEIAGATGITPGEKARIYVQDGIRRDYKKLPKGTRNV